MRLQPGRTVALLAFAALATAFAGCSGTDQSLPLRRISIQGPISGPLKSRAADIRRAAALELEAINGDTDHSRLELSDGPSPKALATIDAYARVAISGPDQLSIRLEPPLVRSTKAVNEPSPQIWLLPPRSLVEAARQSYREAGAVGATSATADSPLIPGTPAGRYITPALSAANYPPAGREFFDKFKQKYGRAPDRYAIYGYESVGLIVDALTRLEKVGAVVTPASLAKSALAIRNRFSPLGHYDVLPSGQATSFVFEARGDGAPAGQAALIETLR
jgi:hypothetical protein